MKKLFCVLFTVVLSAGLSANPQDEGKPGPAMPVTITVLLPPEMTYDGFKAVVAEWEKKTGNKVDIQNLPNAQITQVILTRIGAGEGPDIFRSDGKPAEYVFPPDSVVPFNDRPWFKDIPEATRKLMAWTDGTIRYTPLTGQNAAGVAYDKKVFKALGLSEPKNRKEFLQLCETLKKAGKVPLCFFGAAGSEWGLGFWTHPGIAYYDRYMATPDYWDRMNSNKAKYADNVFYQKILGQLAEYIDLGYTNADVLSTTFDMAKDRFAKGEVVMALVAEWIYAETIKRTPDFELGFFPLPVEDDKEGVFATFIGTGIAAWNGSKNKKTVVDFFDFFSSKEMQELYYTVTPGTPLFPYAKVKLTPVGEAIIAFSAKGLASPRVLQFDRLWLNDDWGKLLQDLVNKQKTPIEVLQAYDRARIQSAQQKKVPGF